MKTKPCPFCGCTEVVPLTDIDRPISMCCTECEASGPPSHTEADARMRWNAHKESSARGGTIPTFEEAWKRMEAKGYHYGRDALENVELGWQMRALVEVDALAALRELVRLKDLHDRLELCERNGFTAEEERAALDEYRAKKPQAWATARALLTPRSQVHSAGDPRWIPAERLPESGTNVLVNSRSGAMVGYYRSSSRNWVTVPGMWPMAGVTHWMPLPPPPSTFSSEKP